MRISELARVSGVPVATIKFYLRERLLPEGRLTSATQAQYDDSHLARLRLIRALPGPGGLSIARARDVLGHIDHPPTGTYDLLGLAHRAVTPTAPPGVDLTDVHKLLSGWGWQVQEKDCDTQAALAAALVALEQSGFRIPPGLLDRYADRMLDLAEAEVAAVPTSSAGEAVSYVILGTVLVEPVLLALRRLAQAEASARRFGAG
jgi:DNA-binding transcriptional MerR regulator